MSKFVEGSYASMEDAVHALNAMVTRGYAKEDIQFVTSESKKSELSPDISMNVSTDTSNEALNDYKEDIESGKLVALVEEDASINNDQKTGKTNFEADSPAEDPVPSPDLSSDPTSDSALRDNPTPGNVPVGDDDDKPGSIPKDDDHDLTKDGL
ncbi:hypothetical protein [Marinilactibacillus kalidii]|uniref:hypothetical protein n=1 Tax=Marinilactibacillus kalidii TaxID=2820274 RepID=UPI001ABE987F|nr:hypothetical protein [Marinilactibacillus kalidii]